MDFIPAEFFELSWQVISGLYFGSTKGKQLTKHLTDSYDDFVLTKIDDVIHGFNPIIMHHEYLADVDKHKYRLEIVISNPTLSKAIITEKDGGTKLMTPTEARNRNFTYAAPLIVDVDITANVLNDAGEYVMEKKQLKHVNLGQIPIMVGSKYAMYNDTSSECPMDFGGYFVINGNEKVIVSQDRIAENKTYVFPFQKQTAYSHVAEVRSVIENRFSVPKTTTIKLSSKANQFGRIIRSVIHHVKHDIPVFILFRALGIESDREIIQFITDDSFIIRNLIASIEEASAVTCKHEAYDYILKYLNISGYPKEIMGIKEHRYRILSDVLRNEFLPHVGNDFTRKAVYLGSMVNKLIGCFTGIIPFDDRDSYLNKRIDTPGILLANLFRQYYGKVIKDMKNQLQKEINAGSWKSSGMFVNILNKVTVTKAIKYQIITSGLKYGMATGNWGIKTSKMKQGVAQVLNRLSYNSTLSHLRRVNTQIEKAGKLVAPRKLHGTQFGVICPSETPEGASVGLVKNLSLAVNITLSSCSHSVHLLIADNGLIPFDSGNVIDIHRNTRVVINGNLVGVHRFPKVLFDVLKAAKRSGKINPFTSVCWNIGLCEINVCTQAGRSSRPMYIVHENKTAFTSEIVDAVYQGDITFHGLLEQSVIEFIDVEEANNSMIAMQYKDLNELRDCNRHPTQFTHLELDPSLMLGVVASGIPFANHNQAPRNCYQASMGKQAISLYATNFRKRYDTVAHVLNYPQIPLVQSRASKIVNNHCMPRGMNAIVAIATYTGYNQEDSIMINQSSVDLGLFCSTYYKTVKDQSNKNHSTGEEEFYGIPDSKARGSKPFNFCKLQENGFVKENSFVEAGDVIIGKCMPQKINGQINNKDTSVVLKNNETGFIDRVCAYDEYFTNVNGDGYTFSKVRLRCNRQPVIGDKFASCHAQKGVLGMAYRKEDMPFTRDGMIPDMIVNPHAIPSRMTIAQLMECIMSKACCGLGAFGDATPFNDLSVNDISSALEACGMEKHGNEIMYNSRTGEQILTDIFIGPTYYQRLKHLVADKVHSRAQNGPIVMLTRQPTEGRSNVGALRLGEMESDVMMCHGLASFQKERFLECSDNYRMFICKVCNMPSINNPERNIGRCKHCKNSTRFSEIRIPYAAKLLFQEVQTMNIGIKMLT